MELSTIIYIVLFIVVVILIFKIIKKVIFATLTVVFLVILIVGGIGALIYSDINNLTSQNDYDINLIYEKEGSYVLGVRFPLGNDSMKGGFSSIHSQELSKLDVEKIKKEDYRFAIVINEVALDKIMYEQSYDLSEIEGFNLEGFGELDLNFSKQEIMLMINSQSGPDELVDILSNKNSANLSVIERAFLEDVIGNSLEETKITLSEALFAYVVFSSIKNDEGVVNLLESYKEDDLEIYPDRISFKFVKFFPLSSVQSFLYEGK